MKTILKARWAVVVLWLAAAVVMLFTAPSMGDLVREKGQLSVPDGYSSTRAAQILKEMNTGKGGGNLVQSAMVFYDSNGLGEAGKSKVKKAVSDLKAQQYVLGIDTIMNPFDEPALEDKMISKDGKTIMIAVSADMDKMPVKELRTKVHETLGDIGVEYFLTGNELINEDTIQGSQDGLKKTEYITIIFILVILFAVFRSFVAPFVPLLTVGISYLVSQGIVAILVDTVDFPLSTFTQIFMVAVMFGIGTDYCILLISRYKEELMCQEDTVSAIVETYRTAGKTVFFSGLAVFIGFLSIGLSQFILYRSAVAVAIGIAVMLAALYTVVPFFMAVLGNKLFWPSKGSLEHKESRIWGLTGSFSLKRPLAALLIVAVICAPFLFTYNGQLSFNSMEEISEDYESVKGFNLIEAGFGAGQSMPATVVIKNDDRMDTGEYMALTEKISRELLKVNDVDSVRSLSRPTGDEIQDFQISEQVGTLNEGLDQTTDGLSEIQKGLSEASRQLSQNGPKLREAAESSGKLTQGTAELKQGIGELGNALKQIQDGVQSGSIGAGELKKGLQTAKQSAQQLATANNELLKGYRQAAQGVGALSTAMTEIQGQLSGVAVVLSGLEASFKRLEASRPELLQDADYLTIRGTVGEAGKGASQLAAGLTQMQQQTKQAADGLNKANKGFAAAASGQQALANGFDQLISGMNALQKGLQQAASGQGQVVGKLPSIQSGMEQLQGGQEQIQEAFGQLSGQISQLTDGLNQSVDGLAKISGGLDTAQDYLAQIQAAPDKELSGFFIPQEALDHKDMQRAFDNYLSPDRKIMTIDVVFEGNPYAADTLDSVKEIENTVTRAVKGTKLENAERAISGVTSTFSDLKMISDEDYNRTVILMMTGILLILIVLLRSIIMPIYLLFSLIITYYVSLGMTEFVFVDLLGYSGISWATPFFGFVMLTALGVDYSIFLMDRFNENKTMDVQDAILHAMRNMGTVILSAVLILGGTFAAMYPSGVLSMMQIATVVLTGLVLYALVFLPFFVPVMVKMFGKGNWWPFSGPKSQSDDHQQNLNM
ncbi:putative drug exporter of the RND superfamily [Paenibacillus uliginis N3/975]|uniref:Putative drug exporter of the RND superfamily n=1 Tax=Paenibacillus uliginis N3/975 TaxID=1313296 RepID=A0A1X7H9C4_9BACL|nr:MMPL family transporter [Paenibacillus uliginis]SMF81200.1 putative drug exporter of the RND superfamily [Paenibacillus uliginis N3/975]